MKIEQSGRLFPNKFNHNFDLTGIDCCEQWLCIKQVDHQDIHPAGLHCSYTLFVLLHFSQTLLSFNCNVFPERIQENS
jgi:hypothetical protein